jgi:hypothetical protein
VGVDSVPYSDSWGVVGASRRTEIARIVSNGVRNSPFIPVLIRTFQEPQSLHELYQVGFVCSEGPMMAVA